MSAIPFHDGGGGDIFLTRLGPDGKTQQLFTYLGGNGLDYPWDLRLDPMGNAWLAGQTGSDDFPVTNDSGLASPPTNDPFGPFDAFITVLEPDGGLLYSTYLGGNGDDRAYGIALDAQGHAHVTGYTSSTDLMTKDALHGEHDETLPEHSLDGGDFLLADFTLDGGLDFLSYLGGSGAEGVYYPGGGLIAVDSQGATYFVGTTASADFPVTQRAFQRKNNAPAGATNMVVVKFTPTPPASTLVSLQQTSGSATLGAEVEAEGTNMSAQCELDFGGVPSLNQIVSAHQLQVSVSPHACGAVDVTLSCPGSPLSTLPDGFTFIGCPDSGPVADGGPVTDGGPEGGASGCGCGSTSAPLAVGWVLGMVLLAMVRRQRRNP
jgi:MYXO-CTERM domain-containing protein